MTREEAIKFLTLMRKAVSNFEEYGHDKAIVVIECDKAEAIDMAIEALKAEPKKIPLHSCDLNITQEEPIVVKCEMVFNDEDFAEWARKVRKENPNHNLVVIPYNAESVSADRPRGEWLWRGFNIECSLCGNMPTFDSTEDLPNYCSNCGARMEASK